MFHSDRWDAAVTEDSLCATSGKFNGIITLTNMYHGNHSLHQNTIIAVIVTVWPGQLVRYPLIVEYFLWNKHHFKSLQTT